jgi:CRISPR-associated endonuclease/helicase Cas3
MNAPQGPQAPTFARLYQSATGHLPPAHQARAAATGLPAAAQVPAGDSKTGLVLAWLWRRLHGPAAVRAGTARRLVWALPQGTLVEPAAAEIRHWLARLELADAVALHVVAGSRDQSTGDWREDMHRPAILVGTTDTLLSKALNRGHGLYRPMFPVDFALTVNGAHWVIDEARLCPQATTTLRQLAGFAAKTGTAEPFALTVLSAAPQPAAFRRLAAEPGDYRAIAASALRRHAPGTLTLVVLNTVPAAQQVYRQLRGERSDVTLLHSRFRGIERGARLAVTAGPARDGIVVATPVVEAGVGDLGAALLITEAAPWGPLALRARHGDRTRGPAEILWVPPPGTRDQKAVAEVTARLARLDGEPLTSDAFLARAALRPRPALRPQAVLRPGEFAVLFDTAEGGDIDIAPYLRDTDDLDVEVAWATWTAGADGAPDPEVRHPAPEYRCRVAIGEAVALARDRAVWHFDRAAGRWAPLTAERPKPGELLLVNAADGGYDAEVGFVPAAREPVADSPELLTPDEAALRAAAGTWPSPNGPSELAREFAPRRWQSVDEHSELTRQQAAALLAVLAPSVPREAAAAAVVAAYLHDAGKAHPIWQDALCAQADDGERDEIAAGRPWAKSGATAKAGRLEFASGPGFRHELASLMLLDGPLRDLLATSPDPDLTRYLVLAHHGRLRTRVDDPGEDPGGPLLGLSQGALSDIPPMLGHQATTLTVDLAPFRPGLPADGDAPWAATARSLVDRYGPNTLAYLETVVRMADWRASGGRELPE